MPLAFPPPLPAGRQVHLVGRGDTFVREVPGPPGAPTVLLLHGWLATAALNWWMVVEDLGRHFRVLAVDHRGHGRGLRNRDPFRLVDCAGDAAVLLETLDAAPAIAVGYSMGGPIAQLLWREHPQAVSGLVLCATSAHFPSSRSERLAYASIGYSLSLSPARVREWMLRQLLLRGARNPAYTDWLSSEVRLHDTRRMLEAGRDLGRFDSRPWLRSVDVPATSIITTRDELVPVDHQRALAAAIPGATVREIDGDHLVCARRPRAFSQLLVAACREVADRAQRRRAA